MNPPPTEAHTPTPWPNADGWADQGNQAQVALTISDEDYEFARSCVNSHASLLSACEAACAELVLRDGPRDTLDQLRAAIASARKELV